MSSLLDSIRDMDEDREPIQKIDGLWLAKEAVNFLTNLGMVSGIAGGYCRDLAHQAKPKDIDVVASFPDGEDTEVYSSIMYELSRHLLNLYPHGISLTHHEVSCSDIVANDERLACVLGIKGHLDYPVDIIFYAATIDGVNDISGITAQFDYNLNQYALVGSCPVFTGESHPSAGLVALLSDLREERKSKMQTKWEAFYGKAD